MGGGRDSRRDAREGEGQNEEMSYKMAREGRVGFITMVIAW